MWLKSRRNCVRPLESEKQPRNSGETGPKERALQLGAKRKPRVALDLLQNGAVDWMLADDTGKPRALLDVNEDGPRFALRDASGKDVSAKP